MTDTDALTGLLNRRAFFAVLECKLARAARFDRPLSVAFIGLDDFKKLNDRAGHAAGDRALAAIGRGLRLSLREQDISCRLGGDEFAVLLLECDWALAKQLGARIQAVLQRATRLSGAPLTASIGLLTCPTGQASDAAALLAQADALMYSAKRDGKGACRTCVGRRPRSPSR